MAEIKIFRIGMTSGAIHGGGKEPQNARTFFTHWQERVFSLTIITYHSNQFFVKHTRWMHRTGRVGEAINQLYRPTTSLVGI